MHTWKPDAYGEAPGVVGALLAGGVTNCAFLAILRVHHLCGAAGEGAYSGRLLVLMGLLSMAIAGIFMVGQRDFKRMLAYSSVEHMGILVLGIGVGGAAAAGALFHVVNNGVTKGVLFLSAGNIHRAFGSKSTDEVAGALRRLPLSAWLFLAGFFAITGSPPFGPFLSEFAILNGTFGAGRFVVGAAFLFFLLFVFVGMGATVLRVALGRPPAGARATTYRDGPLTCAPIVLLLGLALLFGLHPPDALRALLDDAARFLETRP
jgi:hydrogenase-4 component F